MASKDVKVDLNVNGDISSTGILKSTQSLSNEGGQIELTSPSSGSTINTAVVIDVYQNKLRFFEQGGDARGYYIDITGGGNGAGTNLVGGGSASDSFKTIAVSGQSNVVADSSTDTLTLVAGTNVSITTDATTDSITINSAGTYTNVDSITYPDYITFDTTPETVPTAAGSFYWDSGESAPGVILNANVDLKLGQENVVLVKNATGSSIAKGKVVYINGAAGQRPTVTLSDADTEATSSKTLGLMAETLADGAEGFVTTFGVLRGVDTDGLSEGAMLWLSSTAGGYTTSIPAEPAHSVFLGYVVKAHISSGEIFVNPQNGYELNELHGVLIEADDDITDNEVLAWDDPSGLWKNQTHTEAGLVSGVGTNKISYQTTAPSSPTTGDIWIDSDATTSTINLDDIGDVTITSNTSGELLSWNGSAWINQTTTELNLLTTSSFPEEPANADAAKDFGYVGIPQTSTSTGLNLTASHAGKHIYTTATGQTHTIPANSSVPLEIGTTFVFINAASVSTSIAITTDTLLLAGEGTTGTRTLAAHGMATAVKITSTSWIISGTGLT